MNKEPTFKKIIRPNEAKQLLEQMRKDRSSPSGYKELDQLTGGLVKNGVTLIGGRIAMGKTALVLNIVSRLSLQKTGTILIFSPILRSNEISIQLLSIGMEIPPEKFWDNKLPADTIIEKFKNYYSQKTSRISFDLDSFLSLDEIWERCSAIRDLQLIVINPVNAICEPIDFSVSPIRWNTSPAKPEEVFRVLQKLARTLDVPVLCTTNLHRSLEKRKNKRPRLSDLKKKGIPEEFVDQIIFLYRDRYYDPEGEEGAEWIVAKSPRGKTGTLYLDWDYNTQRFTEKP